MQSNRPEPDRATLRRWKALAWLSALALLLHAGLLGRIELAWPGREPAAAMAVALQTRSLVEGLPAAPPDSLPGSVSLAPEPPPKAGATRRPTAAPRRAAPTVAPVVRRPAVEHKPAPTPTPVVVEALAPPAASPADTGPVGTEDVPVYRTDPPPAALLRYQLRRGALRGSAELSWRPAADGYRLRLDARLSGLTVLTQVSDGGFDAAGLAPLRFTDQRARRAVLASNFQRDAGKITFSGPSLVLPLWPGVQDRLSWMLQLAAVVSAEPGLAGPGGHVALHVVGARGDSAVWVLTHVASESVATGGGPVETQKFVREARGPYDTVAEIWLDPRRHHLPVRATLRNGAEGEALEMVLEDLALLP